MNWFWRFYEKLLTKDQQIPRGPVDKALDKATEKVLGPLVK